MNLHQAVSNDKYYTNDHEWIEFQGSVAYVGVCKFKLTGFKQIQEITFGDPDGFRKVGEVVASIRYNDYLVEVHMPVDGKIMDVNEKLIGGDLNILLDCEGNDSWIALIIPSHPYERKNLLLPEQYQMKSSKKYLKSNNGS